MSKTKILIMLFPILYTLLPRPGVGDHQYYVYITILFTLSFILLLQIIKFGIYKKALWYVSNLILLLILLIISSLLSDNNNIYTIFISVTKYLLFVSIFLYGYYLSVRYDLNVIKKYILKAAYIILFFQIIFSIIQLYDIRFFNLVYSMEKTQPLGGLIRVAGTMANPNIFAWLILQISIIILLFEKKKFKKIIYLVICAFLILIAGSRTILVLFPLAITIVIVMTAKKSIKFYFVKLPLTLISFVVIVYLGIAFLEAYASKFPYLSQLLSVIDSKSLNSVNSFNARTLMWMDAENLYLNSNNYFKDIFGIGPGTIPILDNDFLISYYNNGILFSVLNILFFVSLIIPVSLIKDKTFKVLCIQYLLFTLIISFQADTLNGWNYPQLYLFYCGIAISQYHKELRRNFETSNRPHNNKINININTN